MKQSGSERPPSIETSDRAPLENAPASGSKRHSSVAEKSPYLPGEIIGDRYRLTRELGRGGMGVVWVAHALSLEVDVAIKLIHASIAGSAVAARMAREAHAAARLSHAALVRVFDFGWTNRSDPYLVMELVQGETLSAILAREERIDPVHAVRTLLPLADGLRLAHENQVVHRDIKPENILISADAFGRVQPKLLDFGIAKVGRDHVDLRLTQVGSILGSPEYMSPEQACGLEDIDARTDVWSLAVVLYEMVTGDIPFVQSNYNALMQAIIHDPPAYVPDAADCDAALWQIIERGLSKDRDARFPSMKDLGTALALWLQERGVGDDISGNSVRALWLDAVQLNLAPLSRPNHSQPEAIPIEAVSAPRLKEDVTRLSLPREEVSTVVGLARQRRDATRALRKQYSLLALVVLVGTVLLVLLLARSLDSERVFGAPIFAKPGGIGHVSRATFVKEALVSGQNVIVQCARDFSLSEPYLHGAANAHSGGRAAPASSKSPNASDGRRRTAKSGVHAPRDFGF